MLETRHQTMQRCKQLPHGNSIPDQVQQEPLRTPSQRNKEVGVQSPFSKEILLLDFPKGLEMLIEVESYNGGTDPIEHLELSMHPWCLLEPLIL